MTCSSGKRATASGRLVRPRGTGGSSQDVRIALGAESHLNRQQMERLGFQEGKGYVIEKDGKVRPAELSAGDVESKSPQQSMLLAVAYLQARKTHSVDQAKRLAEGPAASDLVHARLRDFGTTRRPEFD